jgi:hypothetical protein
MVTRNIVRLASQSAGFITNASASTTYLTQTSASTTYLSQASASASYAPITPLTQTGFRNLLINGDFRINQRAFTAKGAAATFDYGFDRWYIYSSEGNSSITPQTFALGNVISGHESSNFLRLTTPSTTKSFAFDVIGQKIEDVRNFAGQTVTISFWAKAGSGTPSVAVELIQHFGSGGSPSANVNTYVNKITLSTSWTRYTMTVNVPSISGKTIGTTANTSFIDLTIWGSAGSDYNSRTNSLGNQNNTFDFWGFQLERGSIATPFEQRYIGTELAMCQRYYQTSFSGSGVTPGHNSSGNGIIYHPSSSGGISSNLYTNIRFPIMRTSPTVNIWNGNDASATPSTAFSAGLQIGATGIRIYTAGGVGYNSANIGIDYIRADSISIYAQASTGGAASGLLAFGYSLNAEL